jgi:hypothetical protein
MSDYQKLSDLCFEIEAILKKYKALSKEERSAIARNRRPIKPVN